MCADMDSDYYIQMRNNTKRLYFNYFYGEKSIEGAGFTPPRLQFLTFNRHSRWREVFAVPDKMSGAVLSCVNPKI